MHADDFSGHCFACAGISLRSHAVPQRKHFTSLEDAWVFFFVFLKEYFPSLLITSPVISDAHLAVLSIRIPSLRKSANSHLRRQFQN